jgi:tetratricopeptide (TPR) repeat protein
VFYDNSDRHEWFSVGILFYYAVGLTFLYLISLTIIGLTIKRFKDKEIGKMILKTTGLSFLFLLVTFSVTSIKSNHDFKNWKQETDQAQLTNRELEIKLLKKQLDSLDNEIANKPDNYLALIQRGLLKRRDGQYEASVSDYKLALTIKPDDFNANLELGYSLGLLNKKEESEKYYRIAANIDTNSYFARTNRQYIDNEK